jgi:hypothetical protein
MACQLEKLSVLEDSKLSADRERALEVSKAALLRFLSRHLDNFEVLFQCNLIFLWKYFVSIRLFYYKNFIYISFRVKSVTDWMSSCVAAGLFDTNGISLDFDLTGESQVYLNWNILHWSYICVFICKYMYDKTVQTHIYIYIPSFLY